MSRFTFCFAFLTVAGAVAADQPTVLFSGKSLDAWEFAEGGWVIENDGSMSCKIQEAKDKKGIIRKRGKGYIWTKKEYSDFVLTLSYKLSETANSGVFFRADKDNPVQGGFEVQLLDNVGFQKVKGKKDPKNLNGALYDAQAAKVDPAKPVGQWNHLKLTVIGSKVQIQINDVLVNEADIQRWTKPNENPDGSHNKFKTALNDLPRKGRIGFQNHGQVVWFKDVAIQEK